MSGCLTTPLRDFIMNKQIQEDIIEYSFNYFSNIDDMLLAAFITVYSMTESTQIFDIFESFLHKILSSEKKRICREVFNLCDLYSEHVDVYVILNNLVQNFGNKDKAYIALLIYVNEIAKIFKEAKIYDNYLSAVRKSKQDSDNFRESVVTINEIVSRSDILGDFDEISEEDFK